MFQRRFGYIWVEESENLLNGKKYPAIYMTGYFSVGFLLLGSYLPKTAMRMSLVALMRARMTFSLSIRYLLLVGKVNRY